MWVHARVNPGHQLNFHLQHTNKGGSYLGISSWWYILYFVCENLEFRHVSIVSTLSMVLTIEQFTLWKPAKEDSSWAICHFGILFTNLWVQACVKLNHFNKSILESINSPYCYNLRNILPRRYVMVIISVWPTLGVQTCVVLTIEQFTMKVQEKGNSV